MAPTHSGRTVLVVQPPDEQVEQQSVVFAPHHGEDADTISAGVVNSAADKGSHTDATSIAAIKRVSFGTPTSHDQEEVELRARKLLAFQLTHDVTSGRRNFSARYSAHEPQHRHDDVFAEVYNLVSSMAPVAVATANMLLRDGYFGTTEELVHTSNLLSK